MSRTVAIVGGGITGLAAAYSLRNQPGLRVVVLEKSGRLGGTIQTRHEDGFTVEIGPDSFITTKPEGVELLRELGLGERICSPTADRFYIWSRGALHSLPKGFISLVPTAIVPFLLSPMFSLRCKLDVLREPFRPPRPGDDDESIGSFFGRRFGPDMVRLVAEPLFAGIHASTGRDLSLAATLPQFRMMEQKHGSITRAVLAARRNRKPGAAKPLPIFMSLTTGMESLVEALVSRLAPAELRTGTGVAAIRPAAGGGYTLALDDGSAMAADRVLLTLPAPAAQRLLNAFDASLLAGLEPVPSASTAVVSLAFRRDQVAHRMHASGFVVPHAESLRVTAVTWSSSKWPGRAPEGYHLCRCYFGRYRSEEALRMDDAALVRTACGDLQQAVGLTGEPHRVWVDRWPEAMPQYLVGHMQKIAELRRRMSSHPGLHILGSAWGGVGIPDCIRQARQVAAELAKA